MSDSATVHQLDELDRRIVAALQADPRAPWSQLGGVVSVSETTVLRRVQRLRESGALIIVGAPDPLRCGFGQPVLMHFQTVPGDAPSLAASLAERQDVRYVSLLTGRSDVMCELISPDQRYLSRVLMHDLPALGLVRRTRTEVVLKRFKTRDQWSKPLLDDGGGAVVGQPDPAAEPVAEKITLPDAMDTALMAALAADGRRSYADLSHELELSETAIGRRVTALTAANKLYFVAMVDPSALGFEVEAMLHIRVNLAALESIALALASMSEVRYISATTGYSDLVVDAVCRNTDSLYEFATHKLGQIDGVREVELDIVLESIKREYRYPLFSRDTGTVPSSHTADAANRVEVSPGHPK